MINYLILATLFNINLAGANEALVTIEGETTKGNKHCYAEVYSYDNDGLEKLGFNVGIKGGFINGSAEMYSDGIIGSAKDELAPHCDVIAGRSGHRYDYRFQLNGDRFSIQGKYCTLRCYRPATCERINYTCVNDPSLVD